MLLARDTRFLGEKGVSRQEIARDITITCSDTGFSDGETYERGGYGPYWLSKFFNSSASAYILAFDNSSARVSGYDSRAYGYSVRCVQTTD